MKLLIALALIGQAIPATAPKIPDPDKMAYYKAQTAFQQAQQALNAAVAQINKDCGAFEAHIDEKGDLVCVVKEDKK